MKAPIECKLRFEKVRKILQEASAQDVTVVTEHSPMVVRYLGSDNRYRTFHVTDLDAVGVSVKIATRDNITFVNEFIEFVKDMDRD